MTADAGHVSGPVPSSGDVSRRMALQRRHSTAPELAIRRLLHAHGHRFRVAYPVPGLSRRSIDIAFTRRRLAVFVDGCFWHACPTHATSPRANGEWWSRKLQANVNRDRDTTLHLESIAWDVIRIWEHEHPVDAVASIESRLRG